MGFIGANGAGKTTTIKLLLNLISRDMGEIEILGLDNLKDEESIKERVGIVFDENHFSEIITAENVGNVLKGIYKTWDENVFESYLKRFSLPRKKIIKEYSRGMKMKLALAVALSHNPDLLILDEATGGLDPVVRNEILDVFLDFIQDENHSVFLSSHITSDLEKICDYITFIHNGEIVFSKTKDEVMEEYFIIKGSTEDFEKYAKSDFVAMKENRFGAMALVAGGEKSREKFKDFTIDSANIEDIMMFYAKGEGER